MTPVVKNLLSCVGHRVPDCRRWAFVCGLLAGLLLPARAEEFHVQNWRREDGLPDGQITAMAQTPDGYLWVGTAKGLARFDGSHFKTYKSGETRGFTDSRISSLVTDKQGVLWVGLLDGNIVRREEGEFAEVQPSVPLPMATPKNAIPDTWLWDRRLAMIEEAEGTPQNQIQPHPDYRAELTLDGKGSMWWNVSGNGLMRWSFGKWEVLRREAPTNAQQQVLCDRAGRVWFESDGKLTAYAEGADPASGTAVALSRQWAVLTAASKGGLWVAESGKSSLNEAGRIGRLEAGRWSEELALDSPVQRRSSGVITCLLEDRAGRLWYGTASGGVYFLNAQKHWQRLRPQSTFSQGYISCLFEDGQGNVWVGTVGDGIYRVTLQPATMLGLPNEFRNPEINTLCVSRDGSLWIGTGGSGAIRFDGGHFTGFGRAEGLANPHVCALLEDSQSTLWAGTSTGLFRWRADRFEGVAGPPELSSWVKVLFEDRRKRLWIGTLRGLLCFEPGGFKTFYLRPDRSSADIRCMAEDPAGNLWVGAVDQGLFCAPGGLGEKLHRVAGCPVSDVRALCCGPDGTLWIGGWGSGLTGMAQGRFFNVTTEDGLPSDRIQSILADAAGQLWLSSDNGLIGVSSEAVRRYQRGRNPTLLCQHISLAEGLANGGCSGSGQPVSAQTADGRLWFPDYEGVAVLAPRKVAVPPGRLKVVVESVLADGQELEVSPRGNWQVPSGTRRFEFDYTAPNPSSLANLHFRYKLDGMDHDWVDAGERRAAYYSQLPPGKYQFQVMVGGGDNQWHAAEQSLRLEVVPRLWERRWLQLLAGAMSVALVGGGLGWSQRRKYRLRLERLQMQNAMENERRRIARDLHDEFGSSLTGIALQGEATAISPSLPSDARAEMVSMTRRVRQLIGKLDEVVWATNPDNDSLKNFVAYFCDYAEEFLSPTPIKCRIDSPAISDLPECVLDAKIRHHLLLAAREGLNNSVRYSGASTVWIKMHLADNTFVLEIKDDGKGFDPAKAREGGNGLANIRSRMELIHGRSAIETRSGQGTTVTLSVTLGS